MGYSSSPEDELLAVSALDHWVDPGGIYCVTILAGAVSFLPGGLGATEGTIVLQLVATDISAADAVLASLRPRGLILWLAVRIGLGASKSLTLGASATNEG